MQNQPINSIIMHDGHSRNSLSLEMDGIKMTLEFRKGGILESPVSYKAMSNGGIGASGLYDEWRCKGELSVSASMYDHLLRIYKSGASLARRGATHKAFASVDGGVTATHVFRHILLKSAPMLLVSEFADNSVLMAIDFSLNDLMSVE
jgi:hypothetical protein